MQEKIEAHGDKESLELEIIGKSAYKKAQAILEAASIDKDTIEYVSIEFLQEPPNDSEEVISDNQSELGDASEYEEVSYLNSVKDSNESSNEDSVEHTPKHTPKLREGSKRRRLLKHLDNMERFAGTKEIRNEMSKELEKDIPNLSNDLWELSDIGFIEKKDKDDKGHLNEYKITGKGKEALR